MSLICVDTQILIWGVKREASDGQEAMIKKAARYFEHLDASKDTVLVPTVVLSEFLAHIPKETAAAVLAAFQRRFMIAPFDAPAAAIAANLWREKRDSIVSMKQGGLIQATIKADVFILATALARQASRLTTHDTWLAKLADGHLAAGEMPNLFIQPELVMPQTNPGAPAGADAAA